MTRKQYLAALHKLGLTPASMETADALGLTVRACQFYAAGQRPIPQPVALLLGMYLRHGISKSANQISKSANQISKSANQISKSANQISKSDQQISKSDHRR
jgi:hypothetical protein